MVRYSFISSSPVVKNYKSVEDNYIYSLSTHEFLFMKNFGILIYFMI